MRALGRAIWIYRKRSLFLDQHVMANNPVRRRPPEKPASYDWNIQGQQKVPQFATRIFKPTINVIVRRPTWKGTETIFRPYPSLDYVDPMQFEPYRLDAGGSAKMSNWIRRYDAAFMVGDPPITFLTEHPDLGPRYNPAETPLGILNMAIRGAIKQRHEQAGFGALVTGDTQKGASLDRVNSVYLMQGLLMVHNSEVQYGQNKVPPGAGDRAPCVLMLKGGTGNSQYSLGPKLISMLDEENPDFSGDPEDFESRYLHGDPVSLDSGRYMRFFQQGADPRARMTAQPQTRGAFSVQQSRGPQSGGAGGKEIAGYDIQLERTLPDGTPACLNTEEWLDTVRTKWLYWEDSLYFPTYLEQAHMLNRVFPANAIVYAFENYNKDWITEETWTAYLQRESASVPAAPPGHGAAPAFATPRQGQVPPPPPPPPGYRAEFNTPTRQAAPVQQPGRVAAPPSRTAAPSFGAPTGAIVDENENAGYPGESTAFPTTAARGYDVGYGDNDSFDDSLNNIPSEYDETTAIPAPEEEVTQAAPTRAVSRTAPAAGRRAVSHPAQEEPPTPAPTATSVPAGRGGSRDVAAPAFGIPDDAVPAAPETRAPLTPAQRAAARLAARPRS